MGFEAAIQPPHAQLAFTHQESNTDDTSSSSSQSSFHALSWTTDPSIGQECFSDWSIAVVAPDGPIVYHVHKVVLAIGPRHSEYFASLFKCDTLREQQDEQSRLESLSPEEAAAMPLLLNFMYNTTNDVNMLHEYHKEESLLIGLCKLAQYLLVPALLSNVAKLCRHSLTLDGILNLTAALETVVEDMEPFYDAAASVLVRCAPSIDKEMARRIHPQLLMRVFHTSNKPSTIDGTVSFDMFSDDCILTSMEHHKADLTEALFDFLGWGVCARSDPYGFPSTAAVRGKSAIRLLLLSAVVVADAPALNRVQEKCIDVITHPLPRRTFSMSTANAMERVLTHLPKNVLVAIIAKLAASHQDVCGVLCAVVES